LKDDGYEPAAGKRLLVPEDRQDGQAQAREEEAGGQSRSQVTLQPAPGIGQEAQQGLMELSHFCGDHDVVAFFFKRRLVQAIDACNVAI
jgi:hypothetical protein